MTQKLIQFPAIVSQYPFRFAMGAFGCKMGAAGCKIGSLGAAVSFRFVFIQSFFALQSVVLQNLRNFFNP